MRRDPAFNSLALAPVNPGPWQVRITELAGIQSADPDKLAAFRAKGGKVLMAHGKHDPLVSNRTTQDFARQLEAKMGDSGDFLRYYEIPGYGHAVSTVFNASWDSLTALERWAKRESNQALRWSPTQSLCRDAPVLSANIRPGPATTAAVRSISPQASPA